MQIKNNKKNPYLLPWTRRWWCFLAVGVRVRDRDLDRWDLRDTLNIKCYLINKLKARQMVAMDLMLISVAIL